MYLYKVLNKNNKQYDPLKFNLFVYIIYFFNYNLLFNEMKDISLFTKFDIA